MQWERTVKSLYESVNPCDDVGMNATVIRRRNALALFQVYAERAMASGVAPKGLEQSFAASLEISPSMWSQVKSARPIGDKLARQIEVHSGRPVGWLDEARDDASPSDTERAFLELALKAWRSTTAAGRRDLRNRLKALVDK
ncbi:hypothetical protein BH10PSE17_BH10PSE17_13900 [soil metagenome]